MHGCREASGRPETWSERVECMMNYDVGLGGVCLPLVNSRLAGQGVMHGMACRFDRSVALHARSSSGLRRWLLAKAEGESLDHAGSIKEAYLFRLDLHAPVGADAVYGRSIHELLSPLIIG